MEKLNLTVEQLHTLVELAQAYTLYETEISDFRVDNEDLVVIRGDGKKVYISPSGEDKYEHE